MVQSDLLPIIGNSDDGELLLGDIILAYETCMAEAQAKAIPLADHAAHLFVHGALHLLGYDHGDDYDAEMMERLEQRALASLGIADPYAEPVMTDATDGAAKS
jgi:probable rRNA maturation factor